MEPAASGSASASSAGSAGFEISEHADPLHPDRHVSARAFLVGLLNTLFVSALGIVLATLLGVLIGVARLSPNWLVQPDRVGVRRVIRNTPLLVQLFVIYFAVFIQLPPSREAIALPGAIFLTQRGVFVPGPQLGGGLRPWLAFVGCRHRRSSCSHVRIVAAPRGCAARDPRPPLGSAWLGFLAPGRRGLDRSTPPMTSTFPPRAASTSAAGLACRPSSRRSLTGLVLYTAAFIGEVVRGGIQAVRRGQVEAARALGLSEGDTLRLVVFPQALRVIVPPLTSQYLNLTKNSSLAIAIGYPDLFKSADHGQPDRAAGAGDHPGHGHLPRHQPRHVAPHEPLQPPHPGLER